MDNPARLPGTHTRAPKTSFRVLVTVAHGTPVEISHLLAQTFMASGFDTTLMSLEDITSLDEYDAVVAGSAVQNGRWIGAAKEFVRDHKRQLRHRMVWLFSSGSTGNTELESKSELSLLNSLADPLDHKLFDSELDLGPDSGVAGVFDRAGCSPDEVRRWALHVGGALSVASSSPAAH